MPRLDRGMEIFMNKSSFQFTNPILTDLEMHLNDGFDGGRTKTVEIGTKLSFENNKDDSKNRATVSLQVEVGELNDDLPFYIKLNEQAEFIWDDGISEEMLDRLLRQNAPSLLLSYVRPIIAQITNDSKYGAYNLPFFNFTDTD